MKRLVRLALLACVAATAVPASTTAAPRMFVGFQDDVAFRWREDRDKTLDRVRDSHATLARIAINWHLVAPTRPANASNPFDPAYRLDDVDEFVRNAQLRGLEPMISIWGSPRWAAARPNRVPRRLADLTAFTRAVAARYSGRYPGFPFVRFWGIWNEPNLNQFLSPQFDARGRSVGPANYARLYRAAYTGIKLGNRQALVGMGETSARGRDRRRAGQQDTHSPGRFYELVSKARPLVRFDAVAHHPYPTDPRQRPEQIVRWPNVSLKSLPQLEKSLNKWFKRRSTPIWITEYSHETRPDPRGISLELQADYLRRALRLARSYPYVTLFSWFIVHDDPGTPWQSGLIDENGDLKPAFFTFAQDVYSLDARNAIVVVRAGRPNPVVRVAAREIAAESPPGSRIGVDQRVVTGDTLVARAQPEARLGIDGWVTVPVMFTPQAGLTYYAQLELNDIHGNRVSRLLTLVARRA